MTAISSQAPLPKQARFLRLARFPMVLAVAFAAFLVVRVPITEWQTAKIQAAPPPARRYSLDSADTPPPNRLEQTCKHAFVERPAGEYEVDKDAEARRLPNFESEETVGENEEVETSSQLQSGRESKQETAADPELVKQVLQQMILGLRSHTTLRDQSHEQASEDSESVEQLNGSKTRTKIGHVLRLANPVDTGGAVHFNVNSRQYTLRPGQSREFVDGPWLVRFHRGGDFGEVEQTLEAGQYAFDVSDAGWALPQEP